MHLVYENTKEEIIAIKKTPVHRPPHLHNALEIVYVTEGCVELGVGEELFHMNQGDIGFIFPNIIHHYQVFSCQRNQAIYLNASPFLVDRFTDILENKAPKPPVIKASSIETGNLDFKPFLPAKCRNTQEINDISTLFYTPFHPVLHYSLYQGYSPPLNPEGYRETNISKGSL